MSDEDAPIWTYRTKDLDLANKFVAHHIGDTSDSTIAWELAYLLDNQRREALEAAAVAVERFDEQATNPQFIQSRKHMARRIRALKDHA